MGKCIYCGIETDTERMLYDTHDIKDLREVGELEGRYCCDECIDKKVEYEKELFKPIYDSFIIYLKENGYRVKCECYKINGYSCKIKTEYFNIREELGEYVDTIRRRMKRKHKHEVWIDPCWIKYNGETFEFINYLCFSDKHGNDTRFYFNLVDDNDNAYKDTIY